MRLDGIPDVSVDLILTDPPYYDNISYSELSDFYLAWHQVLGFAEPPYDRPDRCTPMLDNLSVNGKAPDLDQYREDLSAIFREFSRVLKPKGALVFTYHHRAPEAWSALGEAMAGAGLTCTKVIPMRGEGQGGLHSYEGTLKWDAVLVYRPRNPAGPPVLPASVTVAETDVLRALSSAREWSDRFRKDPRMGFRVPDEVNLFRAILTGRARPGTPGRNRIPLSEALKKHPEAPGDDRKRKRTKR